MNGALINSFCMILQPMTGTIAKYKHTAEVCDSMELIVCHNGCVQHRLSAFTSFFDSSMIHGGNDKSSLSKMNLPGDSCFCLCVPRQARYILTFIEYASTPKVNKKSSLYETPFWQSAYQQTQ